MNSLIMDLQFKTQSLLVFIVKASTLITTPLWYNHAQHKTHSSSCLAWLCLALLRSKSTGCTLDISHSQTHQTNLTQVPYSGKLSREKTFTNFTVLWLFVKVFSVKFGGVVSFDTARAAKPQKFSPPKSYFSPNRKSFLPQKFPAIR